MSVRVDEGMAIHLPPFSSRSLAEERARVISEVDFPYDYYY